MKFVWVVVLLTAMTITTQAQTKTTTPAQVKSSPQTRTAPARSFGDLARAERNRQQKSTPAKTVDIQIASGDKAEENANGTTAKPKSEKPFDPMEPKPITATDIQIAQLQQERSDLLLQLSNVIRDRKAVDEIQARLTEIQKRTDELRQSASKPTPKTQ